MAPWSTLLPAALVRGASSPAGRAADAAQRSHRFTLVFFWATFIFFTLSGSRRSYYILPILPRRRDADRADADLALAALSPLARRMLSLGYAVIAIAVAGGAIVMLPPGWIMSGAMATLPPAPDRAHLFDLLGDLAVRGDLHLEKLRHAASGVLHGRQSGRF